MFSYKVFEDEGYVVVANSGIATDQDYQELGSDYDRLIKQHNIKKILVDCRKFEGWGQKDPPGITFYVWMESRNIYDKVAVVFHDGVRNEVAYFEEIFRNADKNVRTFPVDQYDHALEWLLA